MKLQDLKISKRLFLIFATMALIFIGTVSYILFQLNNIKNVNSQIFEKNLKSVNYLLEADRDAYQSRLATLHLLKDVYPNKTDIQAEVTNNLTQIKERYQKYLVAVKAKNEAGFKEQQEIFDIHFPKLSNTSDSILHYINTEKTNTAALKTYTGKYTVHFDALRESLNKSTELLMHRAESDHQYTLSIANQILITSLIIAAFFLLIMILASIRVTQSITVPLKKLVSIPIGRIATGDMPDLITDIYKDDFGQIKEDINGLIQINNEIIKKTKLIASGQMDVELIARSANDDLVIALQGMISKLSEIAVQISEAADNVATGSNEISTNAANMAQGANEQAASVEEVSSSIEEMESIIIQNTENARATQATALDAAKNIEDGSKSVETTVEAMRQIIEKIQIVTDIADKTDLLAINAAIEAARAGEHGEGFAVVAGEVRKLAELSKEAAKEINKVSKTSLNIAVQSGEKLKQIVPQIKKTAILVEEIASASNEQSSGIQQITTAIGELNNISQQNAASAEELSTSSEELTSQADILRDAIAFFSVKGKTGSKKTKPKSQHATKTNSLGFSIKLDDTDTENFEKY